MHTKFLYRLLIVSLIGLIILVLSSNPNEGGPAVVLLFLGLNFLLAFSLAVICMKHIPSRFLKGITLTSVSKYYSGLVLASGWVFLLGLQTIRQLQVIDIALIICFELLVNFYIFRRL